MKHRYGQSPRSIVLFAVVCVLAVFIFLLAYSYDNKYAVKQPQAHNGVLVLDEETLAAYPMLFLIKGWEYYGGRLLSPEDFLTEDISPDMYLYIGQYGGFEAGDKNASPHGSATYRLTILIPEEPRDFMLEFPEIFSSYRAYINGREVMRMGDPDPASYRAETGNRSIGFEAGEKIEIIIAVSDFSHIYSGMTYPPAFGSPDSVSSLLSSRLVLRSLVCAVALTIALFSILTGLLSRHRRLTILYGLLCLSFVGFVSYPILQTFIGGLQPLYAIENISFCAILLLVMCIQLTIEHRNKWAKYFIWFGLFCCAAAAIMPFLVPLGSLVLLYGYSYLITAYEWIAAGFITFTAVSAVVRKTAQGPAILSGVLFFVCALVMNRLFPLYEPITSGWFIEIAGFVMVVTVGIAIGQEVAARFREEAVLSERASSMERLSEMQKGYFTVLRQEMEETRIVKHDLRHHFTVMENLLKNKQYDELSEYVSKYSGAAVSDSPELYSDNNTINILAHHYQAVCDQNRIHFDVRCQLTDAIRVSDADLCGVLSNLLENAVEACLRYDTGRRTIRLGIMDMGDLVIRVENSTDGNIKQKDDTFLSSKGEDRLGYGLTSVRNTAARNGGTATFTWDRETRIFTSLVVI